jgi:hypothetical protein
MKIVPGKQRIQDHKAREAANRSTMWRGETTRIESREWGRSAETIHAASVEDIELDCERWDGLS